MLDLWLIIKKASIKWLTEWLKYMDGKIKDKTPEDTWRLIQWYETKQNGLKGEISNNIDYSVYVEYGVWAIYNYHKNKSIFYSWDGVGMIRRTADEEQKNLADLVAKTIANEI